MRKERKSCNFHFVSNESFSILVSFVLLSFPPEREKKWGRKERTLRLGHQSICLRANNKEKPRKERKNEKREKRKREKEKS